MRENSLVTTVKEVIAHRDCPYFGLDYYDEEFGAWFFGRDVERGRIITNLQAARLTLLHAESGVGKSSLLRAGVTWRLRQLAADGLAMPGASVDIPVVFSSWKDDPVPELIAAVRQATEPFLPDGPGAELPGELEAAIEAVTDATGATLLIMLDQFEEYFLYCAREPVPERFANELAGCINRARFPANFLISIREDAYAGLGDLFNGRIANVYGNYLHVDYLDRVAAEKAIREPLEVYNRQPGIEEPVGIQDDLVEAVLDQVRAYHADGGPAQVQAGTEDDGRVATPLLQLVMATIWDRERVEGSHELRLSTLQGLEGVRMVVDSHLEKALRALDGGERGTAVDVFDHLVTPSGGKIAESIPDLAARTGHTETQVEDVLEKLDHARIVRPVPAPPGQDPRRFRRYEIFHDVLAPAINRTIAIREERRRARRLRRLAILAASLLAVVTAIGIFVGYLYTSANNAKRLAQSRQLAAAADEKLATDPELSTLLALQALHVAYTPQAEEALRQALPESQEMRELNNRTTVFSAAFDPANAAKVVTAGEDGVSWIWSVPTGRRLVPLRPAGGFRKNGTADVVAFNPAGTQVAVGYGGGTLALFSASTGRQLQLVRMADSVKDISYVGSSQLAVATASGAFLGTPGSAWRHLQPSTPAPGYRLSLAASQYTYSVAADPVDSRKFAVAGQYGTSICEIGSGSAPRCQWLNLGDAISNQVAFSPNGGWLATANDDGTIRLFDTTTRVYTRLLYAGDGNATSVQFNPAGTLVVAGYTDGLARVWNPYDSLQFVKLAGNAGRVNAVGFDAGGGEIVTASSDGTTRVWLSRPRDRQEEFSASALASTPYAADEAAYSSGGSRLVVVDTSGYAYVVTAGGSRLAALSGLGARVQTAQFSPDGSVVATTTGSYVDQWQSAAAKQPIFARSYIAVGTAQALSANYSPDGSRLVIVTSNDLAQIRNARTGKLLHTLNPHDFFPMTAAVFRPGGGQVMTANDSGRIQVWNATTGAEVRVLGKLGPAIRDLEFNRTGSEFVTAADSGNVTVWKSKGDGHLRTFDACPTPNTASFSPDGKEIVVACSDGTARVFATATGKLLWVLTAAADGVVSTAEFSPNGRNIVLAFVGGVEVWSSQLATSSLTALEEFAQRRVNATLSPAERASGLASVNGP
jgi:WD40 repeat protein